MKSLKQNKVKIVLIIIGCFLVILFCILNNKKEEDKVDDNHNNISINYNECIVEVKGEVYKTGIYSVNSESRVNDVIVLAGGLTINADISNINLAEKVTDGMVIVIPSIKTEESESNLININTATKEELMTLSGIGEAKAIAIITYRNDNNGFKNTEELIKVNGISEKLYLSIKDKITA